MAIPTYQETMLPLLRLTGDGQEHSFRETVEYLAKEFNLSAEEKQTLLPSGTQEVFANRVGWAKTYLVKAKLLDVPRRSIFKITERGQEVLRENPKEISASFLRRFDEFVEFVKPTKDNQETETIEEIEHSQGTPEEILENAYQKIRKSLAQDLLTRIKSSHPSFFERLVVELLVKMGYGGSIQDAGKATRYTNDEGIDGIIKEDKLGLDVIYVQAKRWDNQPVGRPEIQSFVGALDGQRANKGIFITTSRFAENAVTYVKTISKKVILIDGEQLANYMVDYGLGVSTFASYELKRIDNDYFGE